MNPTPHEQHNVEIFENRTYWDKKPLLRKIYYNFYSYISSFVLKEKKGKVVEIGSGIGNIKMVLPNAICTDVFDNLWLDQVENAYKLSFQDGSVSHLILFDVWHHLQFPGNALEEFNRVLEVGGRIIIFDPAISWLGRIVYGLFHHEPIGYDKNIEWSTKGNEDLNNLPYYAAQGNATRLFFKNEYFELLEKNWKVVYKKRLASVSYVLSGGYSGRQLYPISFFNFFKKLDYLFGFFPNIFGVRCIVVLEKK